MTPPDKKSLVLWIIWFAILNGVIVLQMTLGKGIPSGSNPAGEPVSPVLAVGLIAVVLSTAVRWFMIPRTDKPEKLLVLLIVGLSLSEAAAILGMFLVPQSQPETKLTLFAASLLGILQHAPIYTRKRPAHQNEFHRS